MNCQVKINVDIPRSFTWDEIQREPGLYLQSSPYHGETRVLVTGKNVNKTSVVLLVQSRSNHGLPVVANHNYFEDKKFQKISGVITITVDD